ncbi:hypothetical protein ACFSCW_03550 [Sphingomonas tabacisoli]|uniref:Uncharacterized protein n=1 Tax=Sphingomonas tabacisoli TaxID=2249466 RepID=A0ABW4I007_9SPHN
MKHSALLSLTYCLVLGILAGKGDIEQFLIIALFILPGAWGLFQNCLSIAWPDHYNQFRVRRGVEGAVDEPNLSFAGSNTMLAAWVLILSLVVLMR